MINIKSKNFIYLLFLLWQSICQLNEITANPTIYPLAGSVNVINGSYYEATQDLILFGCEPVSIKKFFFGVDSGYSPDGLSWHFNHPNIISSEITAIQEQKKELQYEYEYDIFNRLSNIKVHKPGNKATLHQLDFEYLLNEDQSLCIAKSNDNRSITYFYHSTKPSRSNPEIVIDAFEDANGGKTIYEYIDHPLERKHLLKKIIDPHGGYIENEYYSGKYNNVGGDLVTIDDYSRSSCIGRIKLQKAPLGPCNSPIITQRFFYGNDYTDVIQSNGVKNRYYYSKNQKISRVETYLKEELNPHKVQQIYWTYLENLNEYKIGCTSLTDNLGKVHSCEVYFYDDIGNLIEERAYGNLSGKCTEAIVLNDENIPKDNGIEFCATIYEYDSEMHLLTKKIEPSGKITRYRYYLDTKKQSAIFIEDSNRIWMRQFFIYDEKNRLIKTITDDGIAEDLNNMECTTERHSIKFSFNNEGYGIDLPSSVEEYYYDFSTGNEILIKKSINHYNLMNLIERQDIYDSEDKLFKSISYKYDNLGKCVDCEDSFGSKTIVSYDLCGRIIEETSISKNNLVKNIKNNYDIAGRLIRKVELDSTTVEKSSAFQYDGMNNCVAAVDEYGNETHFSYDQLGRLVSTEYPSVDSNGSPSLVQHTYDIANNIILTIDPKGYKTEIAYNLRKDPISIFHPDGTNEHFIYNLDGTLLEKTTLEGMIIRYERDIFGRVVDEKILSRSGSLLSHIQNSYSAFHLLTTKDIVGKNLNNYYNSSGKLIKTEKIEGDNFYLTEYEYDNQGRQSIEKQYYDSNSNDFFKKINEFDEEGNLVSTKIENCEGRTLRLLEPESTNKINESSDAYIRDRLQSQKKITFDNNGNTIVTSFDGLKRPISYEKNDIIGKPLQHIYYKYDPSGNCIEETHTVFYNGHSIRTYVIEKKYGPNNRLESIVEGKGSKNQRSFFYTYNQYGKLDSITKNDGVLLYYKYNDRGQIDKFFSSDQSINYEYVYDDYGNITLVYDHVNNRITEKKYDNVNNLLSERLGNDLTIHFTYDSIGRNLGYTLPDGSSIKKSYLDLDLQQIDRYSSQNQLLYSYKCKKFDLKGRLLNAEMIKDLGEIQYHYNQEGLCDNISTPFWKEAFSVNKEQNSIFQTTQDLIGITKTTFQFNSEGALISEDGKDKLTHQYDSMGNRQSINEKQLFLYSELNEIIDDGVNTYKYDLNGNQIEIANSNSKKIFSYDALNRLISVQINSHTKIQFLYDSSNRRLEKNLYHLDGSNEWKKIDTIRYLYISNDEIGTVNENNEIEELRILNVESGSQISIAISFEIKGSIFSPIHDQHGNLRCLIDCDSAKIKECYRYSGYGIETIFDENGDALASDLSISPWRYSGKRIDIETNLIFFGKRYYQPNTGRWTSLDSLGLCDGINRYLFCQNNPITKTDQYGMFSISTAWTNFIDFFNQCLNTLTHFGDKTIGFIRGETEYLQQIQPNMTVLFENYFGKGFLTLMGYYTHPLENGIYGQGEVHDKVRITLINGILNTRAYYSGTLDFLNKTHGGANIHYIFRPTGGWSSDFLQGVLIKCGYISPYAKMLASTWKQLIEEMGGVKGGGSIIHYCHSLGGADTIAAASLLTPEELSMIKVISFGSASIISNEIGFADAVNYISIRDGVSMFADPIGYIKGLIQKDRNVIFIGSFFGLPFVDHALAVQSYTETVTTLGYIFMETYANSM